MGNGRISAKQAEILEYIKAQILEKGYPPAVREICSAVHLKSTSSVHSHLETLEKNGYIRRDPTKPRAIEIIDDDFNLSRREIRNIPLLGHVAAGAPLFAEQNIENYFPMLADQLPAGNLFMLDVRGESMINVGIYDGDKIIVQQTPTAKDGDIVVALIDDSATVKTYYKESGRYRLQAWKRFYGANLCKRSNHIRKSNRLIPLLLNLYHKNRAYKIFLLLSRTKCNKKFPCVRGL